MARQDSFIKLNGKVGDLSFFKTKDGYQARTKGGVSADRIKNDPNYKRTRENNAEFTEVTVASKIIRDVLRSMILLTHDPKMATRLSSRVFKMIKLDVVNVRGKRKVLPESFGLLKDFNFNEAAPLNNTLFVTAVPTIDRASGVVELTIPEIMPEIHLAQPKGATHFRLTAGAALVSLDEEVEPSVMLMESSNYQAVSETLISTVLTSSLPPNALGAIMLVFGVSFYQEVNTLMYPMNNGGFNPLCTVAVDTP